MCLVSAVLPLPDPWLHIGACWTWVGWEPLQGFIGLVRDVKFGKFNPAGTIFTRMHDRIQHA